MRIKRFTKGVGDSPFAAQMLDMNLQLRSWKGHRDT